MLAASAVYTRAQASPSCAIATSRHSGTQALSKCQSNNNNDSSSLGVATGSLLAMILLLTPVATVAAPNFCSQLGEPVMTKPSRDLVTPSPL